MPSRSPRACTGCGTPIPAGQLCPDCTPTRRARTHADRRADVRGYSTNGHRRRFRRSVLTRDPLCVLCGEVATVADHHPLTRRQLIAAGLDPNDPANGRGLCHVCHSKETAVNPETRGGWNKR